MMDTTTPQPIAKGGRVKVHRLCASKLLEYSDACHTFAHLLSLCICTNLNLHSSLCKKQKLQIQQKQETVTEDERE